MASFVLNLNTEGAAFEDAREQEVARLLRKIADQVSEGRTDAPVVHDVNGGNVGSWELTFPEPNEDDGEQS